MKICDCPFCGNISILENVNRKPYGNMPGLVQSWVVCSECRCQSPMIYINTDNRLPSEEEIKDAGEQAIKIWNIRKT